LRISFPFHFKLFRQKGKNRSIEFPRSDIIDAGTKWREAALNRFDNSRKGYLFIKRDFLEDKNLYFFRPGHEKTDFQKKLLQRVLMDKGEKRKPKRKKGL
jgi:hypothetical protein